MATYVKYSGAGGGGGGGIGSINGDTTSAQIIAGANGLTATTSSGTTTIGTTQTANRTVQTNSSGALTTFPENATTTSSAAHTIDWNNGPAQSIQLRQSITLTLINPSSGQAYVLRILQDTSFRGITWPASVKWAGGIVPVITQVSSAIDMISLYYDGTNYWGTYAQNFS